ncbi:MAG: ATP-binding protein, partial [Clostridia bacterium]|nr:ATP-binding protein [Clostridia bacterium]
NEEMLKQVWINLLDNAVKFTPDFGTVRVALEESDGILTVSISNTGSTIPPEKLGKIWNKFYQADESHASSGNGIGLAIVKKVIELHGGEVGVTSVKDLTTFTVKMPL